MLEHIPVVTGLSIILDRCLPVRYIHEYSNGFNRRLRVLLQCLILYIESSLQLIYNSRCGLLLLKIYYDIH
jgi:hypothetical protein